MCIVVPYILNVYNTLEEEYTDFNIFYNGYKRTEQLRLRVCVLLTCYLFAIAEFFVLLCSNNYCKHWIGASWQISFSALLQSTEAYLPWSSYSLLRSIELITSCSVRVVLYWWIARAVRLIGDCILLVACAHFICPMFLQRFLSCAISSSVSLSWSSSSFITFILVILPSLSSVHSCKNIDMRIKKNSKNMLYIRY